ncbi:MAG: DUF21 domain-containing protein [Elusimicrobia bacterium]|nr:DUF21 domain-containing protein [Elusimicrobiota bacterium]
MEHFTRLLIALGLLLLNAFFVLAEFAIVKVRATRLEEMARQGNARAKLAKAILRKLDAHLSVIQLGITIASLGLGWIGEPAMAGLLHPLIQQLPVAWRSGMSHSLSFALAFIIITGLHVVIGELVPKSIAIRTPEQSTLWVARPLELFYRLFYVPLVILNWSSNTFLKLIGFKASASELAHSEEELRMILFHSEEQGKIPLDRLLLFENLFDFRNTTAKEVMTSWESVASLDTAHSWQENKEIIETRKFTRYPLCHQKQLNGWVHLKDIALALLQSPKPPDLSSLKRELFFIPENYALQQVLSEFQKSRSHIAFIKNSQGVVMGLVTLEDILEELVGEIRDEFESPSTMGLKDVLVEKAILLDFRPSDKAKAIQQLLQLLHQVHPFDLNTAWEIIWKRERGLTSAVGHEVAFPHGRLPSLEKPLLAIGRVSAGLEFQAPDNKLVKFIFLFLTPAKEPLLQLRILSKLAHLASNEAMLAKLLKAPTPLKLIETIRAFDQTVTD